MLIIYTLAVLISIIFTDSRVSNQNKLLNTYNNTMLPFKEHLSSNKPNIIKPKRRNEDIEPYFKDYIKKFKPITVWDRIDKARKQNNLNLTEKRTIDSFLNGIDGTEELMAFNLRSEINLELSKDIQGGRRYWMPPGEILTKYGRQKDIYNLRPRLFRLMQHSIYQAREKMVVMQELRKLYQNRSLYKMGFLIGKTDESLRTFSKIAYKSYDACSAARTKDAERITLYEIVESEQRLLSMWFDTDLLVSHVAKNHQHCKDMLDNVTSYRKEKQWFEE